MSIKSVSTLVSGLPTEDGNRVPLTRLVPGQGQRGDEAFCAMDPFLLMDHFGPMVLAPGTDAGFPPKAHKGSAPGYTDLQPESMPWQVLPGGRIRVLAGTWAGVTGPARIPAKIAYAHLELEAGARFEHAIPMGWTAAVVPLHGTIRIEGRDIPADSVALLGEGDVLALEATSPLSLMLLAGEPIGEPIAHYGPFVMNTPAEIEQAILDYQQGRMGHLG